jgi:hypothetical protein
MEGCRTSSDGTNLSRAILLLQFAGTGAISIESMRPLSTGQQNHHPILALWKTVPFLILQNESPPPETAIERQNTICTTKRVWGFPKHDHIRGTGQSGYANCSSQKRRHSSAAFKRQTVMCATKTARHSRETLTLLACPTKSPEVARRNALSWPWVCAFEIGSCRGNK